MYHTHDLSHITQQKQLSWDLNAIFSFPHSCLPKLRPILHHLCSSASLNPQQHI